MSKGVQALSLRPARPGDAERLHALHTISVRTLCAGHYAPGIIDGWLSGRRPVGYLAPIERGDLFVVEDERTILGFGEAVPGLIVAVYVDPAAVRQGVGSMIMHHALGVARTRHDGPIRVESTLNAAGFYSRFGFRELERATLRRGAVDVPTVLMECP